jgi:hypothetical protein
MLKPKPNPLPKPHFAKNKLPFPLTIKILQLIYFHRELLVILFLATGFGLPLLRVLVC